jgi:hypothetical protein
MSSRMLATLNAITSLVFGVTGLLLPAVIPAAIGIEVNGPGVVLVRLAATAYLGYAVLSWLARDLVDPAAWRAIATANTVAWALGAVVCGTAVVSGTGDARAWAVVVMQLAFAIAWVTTILRAPLTARAA